jgi:hypothetical protein
MPILIHPFIFPLLLESLNQVLQQQESVVCGLLGQEGDKLDWPFQKKKTLILGLFSLTFFYSPI